jgi:hypothetical protein
MKFRTAIGALFATFALCRAATAADSAPLDIGGVKVDARARAISFPARVNQRAGAIEYFLVHETGKVHESIFKTTIAPRDIHIAALLFSSTNKPALRVRAIEAAWTDKADSKNYLAAELILNKAKKRAQRETKWAYRGSRLVNGVFLAQRDGSIVSIQEDRDALIDHDTPEAADDENWEPMTELIPPLETPVTMTIRFAE